MSKSEPIEIKPDKRFKLGNIKRTGRELRGNPETMGIMRMQASYYQSLEMQMNPPIVVSHELGEAIKKMGATDD